MKSPPCRNSAKEKAGSMSENTKEENKLTAPVTDTTNTRRTRSLTRATEELDPDLPQFFSLSDPPSEDNSSPFDTNSPSPTPKMAAEFAKASRDIRSMNRPFSGKDKSTDVFNFIAKFKLSLKAYPELEEEHKCLILQSLLTEDAEMYISNMLISNPDSSSKVDDILDALIAAFATQKTSVSRQAYLNSLKQQDNESINLFASRVGISVHNVKNLEYKSLATATGASDEIRQAVDSITFPDTVLTSDTEADRIRKVKLRIIREERKREQNTTLLGVFLRGIKPAISSELIKSGVENMTYNEAISKARDIETAQRSKNSIAAISSSEQPPSLHSSRGDHEPQLEHKADEDAATATKLDEKDIEAIAHKVAQINIRKNGNNSNPQRGNYRGRGRGSSSSNRNFGRNNRGRGYQGNRGNNQRRTPFCALCRTYGHHIEYCAYNPFYNKQQQPRQQFPTPPAVSTTNSGHGQAVPPPLTPRIQTISAMEHQSPYQLPDF